MRYFFSILLIIVGFSTFSQTNPQKSKTYDIFMQAVSYYQNDDTAKALKLARKASKIEPDYTEPYVLMAEIFAAQNNYSSAENLLVKVITLSPNYTIIYSMLSDYFMNEKNYSKAIFYLNTYLKLETDKNLLIQAARKKDICIFREKQLSNPVQFEPQRFSDAVNTQKNEYFPTITAEDNTLLFTRLVEGQEDIYVSHKINGIWQKAVSVSPGINTENNEGAHCLSADGISMIFTRCVLGGGCDLFYTYKDLSGYWMKPYPITELNSRYWDAQPALSADGKTIYFASNRPGGYGKMDIWCSKLVNGYWTTPFNLGSKINTPGNEMCPFIHFDNKTFYFASDTHIGMGGYDIFMSQKIGDTIFTKPLNLGYPINTDKNELRLVVNATGQVAYYSTLKDTVNNQDIYSFLLNENVKPSKTIALKSEIFTLPNNQPTNADFIYLINLNTNDTVFSSQNNQHFVACLPQKDTYILNVLKKDYLFYSESFDLSTLPDSVTEFRKDIFLLPIMPNSLINLKNIFFETDSYVINPKSYTELNNLVSFLKQNTTVVLQVEGHTDSVGTYKYNMDLSTKRAKAISDYIVKSGIQQNRITYKGYGFTKPIADNNTEEGRKLNRRTEILILKK